MSEDKKHNKNDTRLLLELSTFDDESNMLLNMALGTAIELNSVTCSIVHFMLALCSWQETHVMVSKNLNSEMPCRERAELVYADMVYDGSVLADESIDYDNIDAVEYFSDEVYDLIESLSENSVNKITTFDEFCSGLIKVAHNDATTKELFNRLGLNICDIKMAEQRHSIKIPDKFRSYITDMSTVESIMSSTICGVDEYVDKAFEVLSRKLKANPCLIGHAGVGKTSIAYRMAQRIINNEAPEQFKFTNIVSLNVAAMLAGTKYRGDFEERIDAVIKWLSEKDAILFIDELHSFVTAGGHDDMTVASNYLKPVLAEGNIKIIGATTLSEYHKYIEGDTALSRRIQAIEIKEPSVDTAVEIITNSIGDYEKYHGIDVSDSIIKQAVSLSARYMKDKYLPDKAFTVLDQACAKAKIAGKNIVDEDILLRVISENTGIEVNRLSNRQSKKLLTLETSIEKHIVGQSKAITKVCKAIRRSKAGTRDENKPVATFLFVGPTGVGKTELSKVLSSEVIPGREAFIKIDMSEYADKGSITRLIGASPSYIGYGEGGQLTEHVKHNPYSLILFDEIEKACDEAYNILLQLLDEGRLTDGQGVTVDFTNCIIIMTSNVGYANMDVKHKTVGFGTINNDIEVSDEETIRKELEKHFKPEFLNRFDDIIKFNNLDEKQCESIAEIMLSKLSDRLEGNRHISITFSDDIIKEVCKHGYSSKYGARNLKRKIQDMVEDELSCYILDGTLKEGSKYIIRYNEKDKKLEVL